MLKKINIVFFLFFLGLQFSVAQEKIKFRFGINTLYDACNYGFGNYRPANNEYYTFRKIPLTGLNPADRYRSWEVLRGAGMSFNLSLEKKISTNNIIGFGVMLNDHIGGGYRLSAQSNAFVYGSTSTLNHVYSNFILEYSSFNTRRYFITLDHHVSSFFKKQEASSSKEKMSIKTEIHLAANLIQILPSIGFDGSQKISLKTGDSLLITTDRLYQRKFGFSLAAGFNFKLQSKSNKEIVCIGVNYEQGFFNMGGIKVDIFTKNYDFEENIYMRGSRLNVTLSKSFGKLNFKRVKKKDTEKNE
jgi:hypothetical protein